MPLGPHSGDSVLVPAPPGAVWGRGGVSLSVHLALSSPAGGPSGPALSPPSLAGGWGAQHGSPPPPRRGAEAGVTACRTHLREGGMGG